MLPWKLVTEFDKEKHLFSDIVKTNYVVNTFICSCGHIEFIVADASQTIDYTCQMCGNYEFYNANLAIKNLDLFLYLNSYVDLDYKCETNIKKDMLISSFAAYIPQSIDYPNKKVHFKSKSAYDFKLYYNGKVEEKEYVNTTELSEANVLDYEAYHEVHHYYRVFTNSTKLSETILKNLKSNLIKCINTNYKQLDLPTSEKVRLDVEKASFFFQHRHLRDLDFYYWLDLQYIPDDTDLHIDSAFKIILNNRKEKSVKKALFNNYNYQLEKYGYYSTYPVMQFIEKIEDVNILTKLLRLDIYQPYYKEKYTIGLFLDFLLLRYTQKQIYTLFVNLTNNKNQEVDLFNDLLGQLSEFTSIEEFNKDAGKIKCNIYDLHNSITDYYYDKEQKNHMAGKSIDILEDDLKPCGQIEGYEVKLPRSGDELYQWAGKLQNCMASYFKSIQNKDTIIYCFFKENRIEFAVEIIAKKIVQARAMRNILLNDEQNNVLKKWFKRYFNSNGSSMKKEHNVSANIVLDG